MLFSIFVALCGFQLSLAHYDLYINASETEKLLGYKAEFFFVKGGNVRVNSVRYPINYPTDVDCLAFTWRASNLQSKLLVRCTVSTNASDLVDIQYKSEGKILKQKTEFCVSVKCTNEVAGVAAVHIYLDIGGFSKTNMSKLHFVRTKRCEKVLPSAVQRVEDSESDSKQTTVFYVGVGVACSIIFIMAAAIAVLHISSTPKPNKESERERSRRPAFPPPPPRPMVQHVIVDNRPGNLTVPVLRHTYLPPARLVSLGAPGLMMPQIQAVVQDETSTVGNQIPMDPLHPEDILPLREKRNKKIREKLQDILIDKSRISVGEAVQIGTFGRIHDAVLTGPEDGEVLNVLVKTVSDGASDEQSNLLLAEGSMLKGLNHQNINSIMYACIPESELRPEAPLIVIPSLSQGNLKNFLKKSRTPEGTGLEKSVTTRDLIDMALQISSGMLYLEMRKLVHKDLATRNCLIDDEFHVKVTDCALSRDLFPMDYHCLGDNENKPVKWMAVESLEQHRFTTASDVWSFGVTLWELITLGQQPYASIDSFEMAFYLKNGHRLGQPTGCPDDLFTIMGYCWALSEEERPSFGQLMILLTKFFNALIQFI